MKKEKETPQEKVEKFRNGFAELGKKVEAFQDVVVGSFKKAGDSLKGHEDKERKGIIAVYEEGTGKAATPLKKG